MSTVLAYKSMQGHVHTTHVSSSLRVSKLSTITDKKAGEEEEKESVVVPVVYIELCPPLTLELV